MSTGIIFSGNIINPGNVIYPKNMNYQADAKFLWVREHRYVIYSARIHGFFLGNTVFPEITRFLMTSENMIFLEARFLQKIRFSGIPWMKRFFPANKRFPGSKIFPKNMKL